MHRSKRRAWVVKVIRSPRQCRSLFEHGVGAQQERFRNREAHVLRSREIDD